MGKLAELVFPLSRPSRGAWIEILGKGDFSSLSSSRPSRGAWIEILSRQNVKYMLQSRPSRGAWIEITIYTDCLDVAQVAPLVGRVD